MGTEKHQTEEKIQRGKFLRKRTYRRYEERTTGEGRKPIWRRCMCPARNQDGKCRNTQSQ